jgi:type III restriction enzyme
MNTVGKKGRLGEPIRCVVSVSMLTEGWDANTVTTCPRRPRVRHPASVRTGHRPGIPPPVLRPQRRGLFNVEYADVLGIPFDFTAKPVVAPPQPPRETVHVKAVRPDRDALEIDFPRVEGYRVELPEERLTAKFTTTPRWN